MKKQKTKKTSWHDLPKKQKFIVVFLISLTIIVVILMSIRAIIFIKFLAGNDILIKSQVDKPKIDLLNGQEEKITFDTSITANPSCRIKCNFFFEDVTNNITIEQEEFEINSGTPIKKEYTLKAPDYGLGQILYLASMECQGIKTYTCDTRNRTVNRNILVSLNYDLNDENINITNNLRDKLNVLVSRVSEIKSNVDIINKSEFKNDVELDNLTKELEIAIIKLKESEQYWKTQRYDLIVLPNITNLENEYNNLMLWFNEQKKKEVLENRFNVMVEYDTLCQLTGTCYTHETIQTLASETELDITESCANIDQLSQRYTDISLQNEANYLAENYNLTTEFTFDIINKLSNLKNQVKKPYLENLPSGSINHDLLLEIIKITTPIETHEYEQYNLTPAIIKELTKNKPICNQKYNSLLLNNTLRLDILFEPLGLRCGYYGNYTNCCTTNDCRNDPTKYPIIFLHGHDFSKDILADYSLDTFRVVEKRLTEKGYLTAGVMSVSSETEDYGILGLTNVPLTIRGSYYFDVYKNQEDYELLQTKSENIDTYAVRLNDIVNNVKFNTGRPKVIIIAHSMGGLVARRYAQIFGNDSVDKLILIGTPNHGMNGTIIKACPIFGESIECKDMDSTSLFMNKLNSEKPNVKIYNIIGTNCTTDGQPSDGIALESNVYLDGAENMRINGTCEGIKLLHNEMLNVAKYPEVMDKIYYALNITN
nr:hypothetical protein [Nanoarchaeum sp.]